jgi:tRNA ligase
VAIRGSSTYLRSQWDAMERHTEPPYRLTLKSNGCLILISALTPNHLLVASKHSLGTTIEIQEEDALPPRNPQSVAETTEGRNPATLAETVSEAKTSGVDGDLELDATMVDSMASVTIPDDLDNEPKKSKNALKNEAKAKQKAAEKQQKALAASAGGPPQRTKPARAPKDDGGDHEAQAHAEVGREWVRRTLAKSGRTEAELAKRLWEGNMTAVLEVSCNVDVKLNMAEES